MTTTQITKKQGAAPTGAGVAAVGSGGTFAAATYFWKITAVVAGLGEGAPSSEVTVAIVLNGSANLSWTCPAGTTAVRIYRGTSSNGENALVAQVQGAPTTYTDTGGAGTAATPPAAATASSVTKSGALPTKANIPAGSGGLGLHLYQCLAEWCAQSSATTAGTNAAAPWAKAECDGAGWTLAEV